MLLDFAVVVLHQQLLWGGTSLRAAKSAIRKINCNCAGSTESLCGKPHFTELCTDAMIEVSLCTQDVLEGMLLRNHRKPSSTFEGCLVLHTWQPAFSAPTSIIDIIFDTIEASFKESSLRHTGTSTCKRALSTA